MVHPAALAAAEMGVASDYGSLKMAAAAAASALFAADSYYLVEAATVVAAVGVVVAVARVTAVVVLVGCGDEVATLGYHRRHSTTGFQSRISSQRHPSHTCG